MAYLQITLKADQMIYAIRKQNESTERLMGRFKKLVQRSRVIISTKKGRYHKAKPTKKYVREAAVMRSIHRKARERKQFYSA